MNKKYITRRRFLSSAATTTMGLTITRPELVSGAQANSKINIALIGCGGRGQWIANLFNKHGGYNFTALADYFQDRVDAAGNKLKVPTNRRFTGLSCYKKILDLKDIDAVAIESPPYFHPEQAEAAVNAGKHVYVAKPIAVDVPGCKTIESSGKAAGDKKLCFLVDFQTRADKHFIEAIKRVHNGAIGDLAFGETTTHVGRLSAKTDGDSQEARLRNWVFDKALSGDVITEQNIHNLDVMSWIMNKTPLHATGTGGRKVRVDVGDCWDHFTALYQYPDNIGITFSSRQFDAKGSKPDGYRNRMFGAKGTLETQYGGQVLVRCKDLYKGQTGNIYLSGVENNINAFYDNIIGSKFDNPTVSPSVRSTLVTILGRTAAYEGRRVTWNELLRGSERCDGRLDGLKD